MTVNADPRAPTLAPPATSPPHIPRPPPVPPLPPIGEQHGGRALHWLLAWRPHSPLAVVDASRAGCRGGGEAVRIALLLGGSIMVSSEVALSARQPGASRGWLGRVGSVPVWLVAGRGWSSLWGLKREGGQAPAVLGLGRGWHGGGAASLRGEGRWGAGHWGSVRCLTAPPPRPAHSTDSSITPWSCSSSGTTGPQSGRTSSKSVC